MIKQLSILTALAAIGIASAGAQTPTTKPTQKIFHSAQAAADALVEACKNNDSSALVHMLGERYGEQLKKIDDAEERQHRRDFYEKAQAKLKIEEKDGKAVLIIGTDLWPVPIPLVKEAAGWRFDTDAGMEELLARRIGENELSAIDACRGYLAAQVDYAAIDRDGDEVREYAQQFRSTEGKRDGLYWERSSGSHEHPSPLEAIVPDDYFDLKNCKTGVPYMGYYFKVLTRQGSNPPGGKYDYLINGNMIAGFALIAWPADYRNSGVMTFVVSHQGKLFEKDLGPDTEKIVSATTEFDPDKSWTRVEVP